MIFDDPAVSAVFADYEARAKSETGLLASGAATRDEVLLSVGPEAAAFLHALILGRRPARILELGTSYGYSTLVMADAARKVGARLISMDVADYKQAYAREQLTRAGLGDVVDLRLGDAVALIEADEGPFDLVLLDIWKDLYLPCFEAFYPKLSEEAVIAADNMIDPPSSRPSVRAYRAAVTAKGDLQSVLLPIGQGIELSVRWSAGNGKL
ncbi:MAG: class I SAM-dependent methyltransferase [Alphaproteobacteria bacterium]|nr:class I SAM-dependent methyltransferase [Alphaproteobacteria bacterium]MBU0795269.1 class I SAM-dependent methyltransferase [Alphaproteobacteria bacterium]MBU0875012.1 class I SAM-dependent methyltransferase [Alphaproteobacteria bacterium]MBU1769198.1 class I SAM-dependent methyltransferase [Alphaproteobacteria bacterium]